MARITEAYLLNVPLENDYKHTLYFTSKDNQASYFKSKTKYSFPDLSYQRKDSIIRIPLCYDDVVGCNYVMYRNTAYSNKWYYAFITKIEYENDEFTKITIETDDIQTWLFDYQVKPSFVEREHVKDDSVGANTYPEGLETGEYVCNGVVSSNIGTAHMVLASTWNPFEEKAAGTIINGIYHGVSYFLIRQDSSVAAVDYFLSMIAKQSKNDAVTGLFMVPDALTNYNNIDWDFMSQEGGLSYYAYKELDSSILGQGATTLGDVVVYKENILNGYHPRNKKLLTHPYQYLNVSNNVGANAIYKYEYFRANPFSIKMKGAISPGCSIRAYPRLYKGCDDNFDEGLPIGKYPICSFNTDMYTNWLTQNSVNIGISVGTDIAKILGGIAVSSIGAATIGVGAIASGVVGITSTLGEVYQHSLVPPQAEGNLNCGDVTYSMGINELTIYKMSIKSEYAKLIDEYFDMFGYKVCRVKEPFKAHRSRYWYTKTIDVNIDGAIPMEDMKKIKDCYNTGITFWRNGNEIGNYSLSNNII